MTKKHKKKNKEKKKNTQDTGVVSQTPPVSTTMSSSQTQDYLCKKIDDVAFSGPGNSLDKDDYHAWCIDEQGLVCDYMDEQLMKDLEFGTSDSSPPFYSADK